MASLLSGDLMQSGVYTQQAIVLLRELDERQRLPNSLATLMLCGGNYQTETVVPAAGGFVQLGKHRGLAVESAGGDVNRSLESLTPFSNGVGPGPRRAFARDPVA